MLRSEPQQGGEGPMGMGWGEMGVGGGGGVDSERVRVWPAVEVSRWD
jgi:hypothetical protein